MTSWRGIIIIIILLLPLKARRPTWKTREILRHAPDDNKDDFTFYLLVPLVPVMRLGVKDKHPFPLVATPAHCHWLEGHHYHHYSSSPFYSQLNYSTLQTQVGGAPCALPSFGAVDNLTLNPPTCRDPSAHSRFTISFCRHLECL